MLLTQNVAHARVYLSTDPCLLILTSLLRIAASEGFGTVCVLVVPYGIFSLVYYL